MQTIETPEGLNRLTVKISPGSRNIYFYTKAGVEQVVNPEPEADDPEQKSSEDGLSADKEKANV